MMLRALSALACLVPALAGVIDLSLGSTEHVLNSVGHLHFGHPLSASALEVTQYYYDPAAGYARKLCSLKSLGEGEDDTDNFLEAVKECGKGGVVRLPDANYTISRPIIIELEHSTLDVHGWISFTQDVQYWIDNRIEFPFQNQSLAFIIRGHDYTLDGNDKGGINGGGQAWYDYARDFGNKFGRPMSLAIEKSKNVVIKNWSIIQPQFWALITIESENILIKDFYVNATSYNPESASDDKNWLQNTDGTDTYKTHNVTFENFVYQGGDDCIALKPNSTMITARNVSCYGGTGIAFGSIAQYPGVLDIIQDVHLEDIRLYPSSQCLGYQGVYFKSWISQSYGIPPNGGGGGYGYCKNVTVKDVYMEDIMHPIAVDTTLTYLPDVKGGADIPSSTFSWYDIHLSNFTGNGSGNRLVWMDCSKLRPCHGWTFDHIDLKPGKDDHPEISYVCNNFLLDGTEGLNQCHPSNSTLETDNGGTL
ncbi:putative polygalacturonase [Naematelia encephala]|uniref:galacturonan 1,4-alpha-galacturonidase n=1 Tax=Naematelia encephala TaxID=71784 RepID=A0A1Y2BG26_9TREE|nr:putative polygalacturonase [Naematelia encephala]